MESSLGTLAVGKAVRMSAKETRASGAGPQLKCTIPQIGCHGKASGQAHVFGVVAPILVLANGEVQRLGWSA
jgi:hypothetical protein